MAKTSNRRRALAVDAQVRRFYLAVVALGLVEVALLGALGVVLRRVAPAFLAAAPGRVLLAACGAALLATLVAIALAAYVTFQTHRMVGSASRVEQALKRLRASGRHEPVVLRPTDYLQEIAAELNGLGGGLERESVATRPETVRV